MKSAEQLAEEMYLSMLEFTCPGHQDNHCHATCANETIPKQTQLPSLSFISADRKYLAEERVHHNSVYWYTVQRIMNSITK